MKKIYSGVTIQALINRAVLGASFLEGPPGWDEFEKNWQQINEYTWVPKSSALLQQLENYYYDATRCQDDSDKLDTAHPEITRWLNYFKLICPRQPVWVAQGTISY